ncbi:MAG TPA: polysaccharide pyruvyl transferase family protein [Rhizobiaceae bacterium]|nr:polysaccharide pyruvyl transferase family protein [Rhizobiaceae bacterium]
MKLVYFKGKVPNFGDELNPYMWRKLLPAGFLDGNENELFLGIGSILWNNFPGHARKIVMGAGYAGYTALPDVHDGSWEIVFVRGPESASLLGIPAEKAICDAAILLRALDLPKPTAPIDVAFMPHYESLDRGLWEEACRLAGIKLIDPRANVETVISELRATRLLITEAMHGAIVADALRTPWVAVWPINRAHHRKWRDWSGALSLEVRHHELAPTNIMELYVSLTGGRGSMSGRAGRINQHAVFHPLNKLLTYRAARQLRKLATCEPQLSRDEKIAEATERALAALHGFVRSRRQVA